MSASPGKLLAVSDLHVRYPENRKFVEDLRPESDQDWLLVPGDIGDRWADIEWGLSQLSQRFSTVVWSPGNHELWTVPSDPVQFRGAERYLQLVALCRQLGVITPEDPYPVWQGAGGPAVIAPLFLLYDYTFLPPGVRTKAEALAEAYETGVVGTDEFLLHPDPYPSREAWCQARIETTLQRLEAADEGLPTILVSHFPLIREPTKVLRYPLFAQWCGTERTADWHLRFRALTVVYGHLHIPRAIWQDGVLFEEVSLGYPSELKLRADRPRRVKQILPPKRLPPEPAGSRPLPPGPAGSRPFPPGPTGES